MPEAADIPANHNKWEFLPLKQFAEAVPVKIIPFKDTNFCKAENPRTA